MSEEPHRKRPPNTVLTLEKACCQMPMKRANTKAPKTSASVVVDRDAPGPPPPATPEPHKQLVALALDAVVVRIPRPAHRALVETVASESCLQPPVARLLGDGRYEVFIGARRIDALRQAQSTAVR